MQAHDARQLPELPAAHAQQEAEHICSRPQASSSLMLSQEEFFTFNRSPNTSNDLGLKKSLPVELHAESACCTCIPPLLAPLQHS